MWSRGNLESNFDMCGEIKTGYMQEDSPVELFKVWASSIVVLLKAYPEKKEKKHGNVEKKRNMWMFVNLEEEDYIHL